MLIYAINQCPEKYHTSEIFFFFVFYLFRAAPMAYGGSKARGPFGAGAAGLRHSHSISGPELHQQSIPPLAALPDP